MLTLPTQIWVDDTFVRKNKKLVTIFYLVEMWGRIPLLFMFHLEMTWASVIVFAELFCMTGLQQQLHTSGRRFRTWKKQAGNLLHGFLMALPLMVVNFHFFDPGLTFQYFLQLGRAL